MSRRSVTQRTPPLGVIFYHPLQNTGPVVFGASLATQGFQLRQVVNCRWLSWALALQCVVCTYRRRTRRETIEKWTRPNHQHGPIADPTVTRHCSSIQSCLGSVNQDTASRTGMRMGASHNTGKAGPPNIFTCTSTYRHSRMVGLGTLLLHYIHRRTAKGGWAHQASRVAGA